MKKFILISSCFILLAQNIDAKTKKKQSDSDKTTFSQLDMGSVENKNAKDILNILKYKKINKKDQDKLSSLFFQFLKEFNQLQKTQKQINSNDLVDDSIVNLPNIADSDDDISETALTDSDYDKASADDISGIIVRVEKLEEMMKEVIKIVLYLDQQDANSLGAKFKTLARKFSSGIAGIKQKAHGTTLKIADNIANKAKKKHDKNESKKAKNKEKMANDEMRKNKQNEKLEIKTAIKSSSISKQESRRNKKK